MGCSYPIGATLVPGGANFVVYSAAFSPDSTWLAYEGIYGDNHDIYLMRRNGTQLKQLTDDADLDFGVAWRPVVK